MYDWKWTSALLCSKMEEIKFKKQGVPTEILAEIFFSCLLNTGIIVPWMPWTQIPPNRGCRAGAQYDKALISSKCGPPGHVSLPFQHHIAPWQMRRSRHRGCCFHLWALLHHSDTCSSVIPAHAPEESRLMVSTQPMFVAHIGNHVNQGGISSDKQLLLQRCQKLTLNGMQLSLLPLKNKSKKDNMNFAGDHCKVDHLWRIQRRAGGHP